jgi:mannose-1-phosphate guanylyltransferase
MGLPETAAPRWAVILAGGSGKRLVSLTRRMYGEDRPKQFCSFFGGRTLLDNTRARIARVIAPERTMYSVMKAHAGYYRQELAGVESANVLAQPTDRGTTAAIAYSLTQIAAVDENATAGFFPADHHFTDEAAFTNAVDLAYGLAHLHADKVLLLGAQPEWPEVEYGWIEPGAPITPGSRAGESLDSVSRDREGNDGMFRVNRFWEKPSLDAAKGLLDRGCLWNTFVMIGRVRTFLDLLRKAIPAGTPVFGDFSKQVLSALPDRLAVLRLDNVGWSDLGTPERVMAVVGGTGRAGTPLTAA